MVALAVTVVQNDDGNTALNSNSNANTEANEKHFDLKKKDYVLEALKKKLNIENRKPEIQLVGEAKNGSCSTVSMKTSLFEYSKAFMMDIISKDERIIKVNPVRIVVAETNHNGEANVEYQLEVDFKVAENEHKVKISCYTTTCNLLIQIMGQKPISHEHLNNRFAPKYFAEEIILPFGLKALATNPNMNQNFIPHLKSEIKKLQEQHFRNKKKTIKPLAKSIKCANENCCSPGGNLITKNITAYAQCMICDNCEHFKCAKVKDMRKLSILDGSEKFVCTGCFSKDPTGIAFNKDVVPAIKRPNHGSIEVEVVPAIKQANQIAIEVDIVPAIKQSNQVAIEVEVVPAIKQSQQVAIEVHAPEIEVLEIDEVTLEETVGQNNAQDEGFWSVAEESLESSTKNACKNCRSSFSTSEELRTHINNNHDAHSCQLCQFIGTSASILESHIKSEHNIYNKYCCEKCGDEYQSSGDLEAHIVIEHVTEQVPFKCKECLFIGTNDESLEAHLTSHHQPQSSNHGQETIIEEEKYSCKECKQEFPNKDSLNKHNESTHGKITIDKNYFENLVAENTRLIRENSRLKDDFERLNDIFETSRNNSTTSTNASDIELAKVREEYRIVKTQNEFLTEKNETLYKLGKIALENNKKQEPEVEVLNDDDEDGIDTLVQSVVDNKKKGYKRTNPTSYAEKAGVNTTDPKPTADERRPTNSEGRPTNPEERQTNPEGRQNNSGERQPSSNGRQPNSERRQPNIESREKISYCHYFSNFGKCSFEEQSGRKCKFSHTKAPVCKFDVNCDRRKCMFSHTRRQRYNPEQGQNNFLYQGNNPYPPPLMNQIMHAMQMFPTWGMNGEMQRNY